MSDDTPTNPPAQTVRIDMSWLREAMDPVGAEKERLLRELLASLETLDTAGREAEWRAAVEQMMRSVFGAPADRNDP